MYSCKSGAVLFGSACRALFSLLILAALLGAGRASAADSPTTYTAYVMAYFNPQQKLYYAWSRDARHWTALNNGQPVFDAGVVLRDPYVHRVGNTFHLVHTDDWNNPSIGHWTSPDLIHWTGGMIQVMPSPPAGQQQRCWAPEFTYDDASGLFYVYWASLHNGHNTIYYQTTRDWSDLSPARSKIYYDLGIHDIDLTIVPFNGTYYAFHKTGAIDDRMGNRLSTSTSLDPVVDTFTSGSQGYGADVLPGQTRPIEGPEVIQLIGQQKWYIYGDPFHAPLQAWETTDFKTFTQIETTTPRDSKHCSMLPVTEAELQALQAAFPSAEEEKSASATVGRGLRRAAPSGRI